MDHGQFLRKRRQLNYEKCKFCRLSKKKCEPFSRTWPLEKCQRCNELGLACSENTPAVASKHPPDDDLKRTTSVHNRDNVVNRNHLNDTLHWAAEKGYVAVVGLLLDNGAELEARDRLGRTPLLAAAGRDHEAVVQLLLQKGADIESHSFGKTPLTAAVFSCQNGVARLLLARGADITGGGRNENPLLSAIFHGHEDMVCLLLESGADIDAKDACGQTPLWWAVYHYQVLMVKLLLTKGASVETEPCYYELTEPCYYELDSKKMDYTAIMQLLTLNGATF